ncbi:PrsW family intramembrane metalloprotease [Clostridium sp. 19966]|uniref:PrsW family glutamic-type intramembrane protease n=1 Tax=Clostridium sp. 19966 TaxID=2768166 RepID=UPI0028DE2A0C|nr:PrsW family glutamic-type intramembrane protease [Clostridium sp. 19966]MDT8715714.1 PrsW family intramembrane metalloprotease [Clostridium sp. 19966]
MNNRISILPIKEILNLAYFKRKIFIWILIFGLTPMLISYLNSFYNFRLESIAWILGAYFCLLWSINLFILISPGWKLWSKGILYTVFTVVIGVPILIIMQQIGIVQFIYKNTESNIYIFRVIGFVFGVGLLEETCKLLPVLILGIRRNNIKSLVEAMYLGAMSGLGFALAEAVQYTIMYWQGGAIVSLSDAYGQIVNNKNSLNAIESYYGSLIVVQIVRFMTLPLFHAVWGGITAWFAVATTRIDMNRRNTVIIGIFFAAVLHGFYDVYSGTVKGIVIAFVSLMIFMGYLMYSRKIENNVDYNLGRS